MDACVAAVSTMEDDHTFDAGVGAFLNSEGEVELDAGIMDGDTLTAGSVAAVSRVEHPVALAREVLNSDYVLLVGSGAEKFATSRGLPLCDPRQLVTDKERIRLAELQRMNRFGGPRDSFSLDQPSDTVGAVAIDQDGRLAAATSTGGTPNKHPGRVGDSPIIGAGFYADRERGGCSTSGWGESILKVGLARTACDLMGNGLAPRVAAASAVMHLHERVKGLGGCIVLNPAGRVGVAFNTPRMAYAWHHSEGSRVVEVSERGNSPIFDAGLDRA